MNEKPNFSLGMALQHIGHHYGWYLALGALLFLAGAIGLYFSTFTTLFSVINLGILLVIAAVFEAVQAFRMKEWRTLFLHALLAILYGFAGVYMVLNPLENAVTLTLLVAFFLIVAGIFRIVFSLASGASQWFLILLSGILSVVLGILILKQWPVSGLWVIGMFVAIEMMFSGITWMLISLKARKAANQIEQR